MNRRDSLAVVLPAHNSAANIEKTVAELSQYFRDGQLEGQVIVVENGSKDNTWDVITSIDSDVLPFELVRTQSDVGLGNAIREGLAHVRTKKVLITADDLPFGFSDIENYFAYTSQVTIAVGSKAHRDTSGSRSISREIISTVFRLLRRFIVGLNLGDTQGTIMGDATTISEISQLTIQTGYLMTTELLAKANQRNVSIVELPVKFRQDLRKSNIKIFSDSMTMLKGLFEIRKSL